MRSVSFRFAVGAPPRPTVGKLTPVWTIPSPSGRLRARRSGKSTPVWTIPSPSGRLRARRSGKSTPVWTIPSPSGRLRARRSGKSTPVWMIPSPSGRLRARRSSGQPYRVDPAPSGERASLGRDQVVQVEVVHDRARVPARDLLRGCVRRVEGDERDAQALGPEPREDVA